MKGEYVEEKKDINSSSSNMFAKLHHTQKFHPHPNSHLQPSFHHPFPVSSAAARECQTSEEADSRSPATPSTTTNKKEPSSAPAAPSSANDGATIEVVRRPRGRPPGSKNKPKPPVIITRETEPAMSPYILELPGGVDIVEAITRFCRKRNMGLCVLNGSGTVTNVTLRQPSTTPPATVTFHGRFDILSLSATIMPANVNIPSVMNSGVANGFTISLAGPQGQVVGGAVVGPLLSAGTVYLIGATFNNPAYSRLPMEDDHVRNSGSGGGGGSEGRHHSPPAVSGGGDSGHQPGEMSVYGGQYGADVIWTPTARQPPPPPPY